jgi:transcriptional regulator with XRE-family HTH domain
VNGQRQRVALAFGAVLRAARREKGLTQERLADAAGLDRTFPSLLERGLRTPTLTVILRLAEVLNVPPSTLVDSALAMLNSDRRIEAGGAGFPALID